MNLKNADKVVEIAADHFWVSKDDVLGSRRFLPVVKCRAAIAKILNQRFECHPHNIEVVLKRGKPMGQYYLNLAHQFEDSKDWAKRYKAALIEVEDQFSQE